MRMTCQTPNVNGKLVSTSLVQESKPILTLKVRATDEIDELQAQ